MCLPEYVRVPQYVRQHIHFVSVFCVSSQCVWPHQLQIRLGVGQSGLQAVFPPSVYWVWLRVLAAHRPAGNAHNTVHTHITTLHVCHLKLNSHFFMVILRERSASWVKSGVSGKGRTQRPVSKEKATLQLSPLIPVNAQRKISTGENSTHVEMSSI